MNILIRSSSYLFPNLEIWKNINNKAKFIFAEYSDFHNNKYFKKNINHEISVIFLKDIVETSHLNLSINKEKLKLIKSNQPLLFREYLDIDEQKIKIFKPDFPVFWKIAE